MGFLAASTDSFTLLKKAGIIDDELEKILKGMVGFRNIILHQYQNIDLDILRHVIHKDADNLIKFAGILVATLSEHSKNKKQS